MRILNTYEIALVSGAGSELPPLPGDDGGSTDSTKNNNGYGNGAESGPPPGNSGAHNPGLLTWNSGEKGVR